jgi:hypothetical protein
MLQVPSNALETVGGGRIRERIRGVWPNCTTTYGHPIGTTSFTAEYSVRSKLVEMIVLDANILIRAVMGVPRATDPRVAL